MCNIIILMRLKSELYKNEQIEIINNIIDLLKLDEDNSIILYELDNDKEKQEKLINMLPDIKKYFSLSSIKSIGNPKVSKRPYLSIIKNITKSQYKIMSCDYRIKKETEDIRTKKYIFIKK